MRDPPREARRFACQMLRLAEDYLCGYHRKMVHSEPGCRSEAAMFPARVSLEQPVLPTEYAQAKIHNLALAMKLVNDLPVPPGYIFSFWHVVGRPTGTRGFLPGRSLLAGKLRPDYGGGLCQLSGLIYYASLMAGLKILERHPHSRDIYDDQTRYAPLGSDATVAYGFKDLRVLNNYPFPVCFRVSVTHETASCQLCSPQPVEACQIEFAATAAGDGLTRVETRHCGQNGGRVLDVSVYRALNANGHYVCCRSASNGTTAQLPGS